MYRLVAQNRIQESLGAEFGQSEVAKWRPGRPRERRRRPQESLEAAQSPPEEPRSPPRDPEEHPNSASFVSVGKDCIGWWSKTSPVSSLIFRRCHVLACFHPNLVTCYLSSFSVLSPVSFLPFPRCHLLTFSLSDVRPLSFLSSQHCHLLAFFIFDLVTC